MGMALSNVPSALYYSSNTIIYTIPYVKNTNNYNINYTVAMAT